MVRIAPLIFFVFFASSAVAYDNVDRAAGDFSNIAKWGSPQGDKSSCPKADTPVGNDSGPVVARISGALELADSMPVGQGGHSPERISVNKFCDAVPSRFPEDKLLLSNCKVYRDATMLRSPNAISTREKARDLLFSEIKRKPKAGEALATYARQALADRYQRCVNAKGEALSPSLGEMKKNSNAAAWQGPNLKSRESSVRDAAGSTGGTLMGGDAR